MKTALSDETVVKAEADMCADQVMDLRNGWVRLCYNPNFVSSKNFCQRKKKYQIIHFPLSLVSNISACSWTSITFKRSYSLSLNPA